MDFHKYEENLRDNLYKLWNRASARNIHKRTGSKIDMIAEVLNPTLKGWINYFDKFNRYAMKSDLDCVQRR